MPRLTPNDGGPSQAERFLAASIWKMPKQEHPLAGMLAPTEAALLAQTLRPMQLEDAPLPQLLRAWRSAGTPAFPTPDGVAKAKWGYMLTRDFLERDDARGVREFLRAALRGGTVVELGVGDDAQLHEQVFKDVLGVADYRSVDSRPGVSSTTTRADMLELLASLDARSVHVAAFGVFNEPLSVVLSGLPTQMIGTHIADIDHSYCRRLCRELNRVVPTGGLVFGDGLRPMNYLTAMQVYISRHGFTLLEEPLGHIPLVLPDGHQPIRDPFFFRRN